MTERLVPEEVVQDYRDQVAQLIEEIGQKNPGFLDRDNPKLVLTRKYNVGGWGYKMFLSNDGKNNTATLSFANEYGLISAAYSIDYAIGDAGIEIPEEGIVVKSQPYFKYKIDEAELLVRSLSAIASFG